MALSSSNFLHLPAGILGDNYQSYIETWIDEAEAITDNETMQKNIVSFRYWETVVNLVMSEPAERELGYESIIYSPEQIKFYTDQYETYRGLVSSLNPPIVPQAGFGGAVLVEAV